MIYRLVYQLSPHQVHQECDYASIESAFTGAFEILAAHNRSGGYCAGTISIQDIEGNPLVPNSAIRGAFRNQGIL